MESGKGRRAFTLVELLVVVSIIALLISLLLPALSAARGAARLAQCSNNLKQTALAMHVYHDTYSALPVGAYGCCSGTWQAAILPQLIGQNMEGKYTVSWSVSYSNVKNQPVTGKSYLVLLCPEDWVGKTPYATTHNYVANFGNTGWKTESGGYSNLYYVDQLDPWTFHGAPFAVGGRTAAIRGASFDEITDGLSNTLLLSEVIQGRSGDLRGLTWWGNAAGFSTYLAPNSSRPDVMEMLAYCNSTGMNPPCTGPWSDTMPMMLAARSRHAQRGVNAATCDGAVHFVSNDIAIDVWQALGTTKGGEAFTSPF